MYPKEDSQGKHSALEEKTLRGTHQDTVPLVPLLSLFLTNNQHVLAQMKRKEGENEISAAVRFLKETNIKGRIITGDVLFAQKKCAKS
ncbi:hypothetical protein AGMMS49949_08510 [Alphaproteobacteria bacterium]|nr:hypothetical protein AGMMS49949_08510 [Alphaproteobacteria bacterium]GHS99539.1 hypothetical protein AGMMS50296_7730 [Alphaproteobacteria bacterium]